MYVVVVAPLELTTVRMFCGGTSAGVVNADGVCPMAAPKVALATATRFVRPVGEVGETVVCGEDLVRVVLGLPVNLLRHRVVDDGDVAAGREEAGQEALPEALVPVGSPNMVN